MSINMKNIFLRSLSALLALISVIGSFTAFTLLPIFAADDNTGGTTPGDGSESTVELSNEEKYKKYYLEGINPEDGSAVDFSTEEKRLAAMGEPYTKSKDGVFELYVDKITGEVAVKDNSTGNILFTNPYDVSSSIAAPDKKMELLSQVYIDFTVNGTRTQYYSFEKSALLGQIDVKRLAGGLRVEYSIGEEESRTLVPRQIRKERFEESILNVMAEAVPGGVTAPRYKRLRGFYELFDPAAKTNTDTIIQNMYSKYPITREGMAIYVFDENAKLREIKLIESYIKEFCPEYTYEQLDADHAEVEYEATQLVPLNFRMALEYYLTENGVEVRFPANGLRFDESTMQLTEISILQYMGAGSNDYEGYAMLPDGSGTLIRFEDTLGQERNFAGKLYGQDYAYQEVGNANREVFRMPVFGMVTTGTPQVTDDTVTTVDETPGGGESTVPEPPKYSSGYLAIVTEGDALTNLRSTHGGNARHEYNSCYPSFYPRPKDSYNLAEAISIGSNTTYTVVSERKYTGSYRIRYIMLTDPANTENRVEGRKYYDTSYVGMAKAYRQYLMDTGSIVQLTAENTKSDIPFYIESFGSTETDETVLSIPITVKKALTSFNNLVQMSKELKGEVLLKKEEICEEMKITPEEYDAMGMTPEKYRDMSSKITNLNFKLVGFTNGGMRSTVPTKVKFEKVVGGNKGYKSFLKYAEENGIGVYPDFDFVYMSDTSLFDGFRYKRDAVKTIDNRYISKRSYDAVLQSFTVDGKICISSSVYRSYFSKFQKSMNKILGKLTTGIAVSTLGSDLNSDFDEDDPYNREDSKLHTEEMLAQISRNDRYQSIMIDSGNAYAIPYADVILNVSLDSSRLQSTSEAIPFFGMVYHGFVTFAGKPTNMAGDVDYEMLKIIENGATLYMILSYDNVELLKEDPELCKYYAISYEIWKKSLLSHYDAEGNLVSLGVYDKLNNALKDVQTSLIDDHAFLEADRVLSDVEKLAIEKDANTAYLAERAKLEKLHQAAVNKETDYKRLKEIYANNISELNRILGVYEISKPQTYEGTLEEYLAQQIVDTANAITDLKIDAFIEEELKKVLPKTRVDDGSVVYVKYDNEHWFILNYNDFDITVVSPVDGTTVIPVAAKSYFDSRANA